MLRFFGFMQGFIPPEDLAIRLMEFAERYPQPFAAARGGSAAPSQGGSGAHSRANSTDGESVALSGISSEGTSGGNLSSLDGTGKATSAPQSSVAASGIAAMQEPLGEVEGRSGGEKRPATEDYGEAPAEPAGTCI
jgi:hypothetical protein